MRVLLTHNAEDIGAYYGRSLPELQRIAEVVLNEGGRDLTTPEVIAAAEGCDVIVAHRSTPGEARIFERLPELVAFLRCAVDTSTVDVAAASKHGVLVGRADHSYVASTAELALGLLLAVERHIASSTVDYRAGDTPPQRSGRQLRGRTAGIIGYGRIGSHLADLLVAVGMKVLAHDPFVDQTELPGLAFVSKKTLLAASDVVFPLASGGATTTGMIGSTELGTMQRGTTLVNVSRGELLDEAAVAESLASGHLGGLGIDVGQAADQRPSPELASLPGVVATPHLGGLTPENADAQAASSVEQVAAMISGEMPPRALNPDAATRLRAFWGRGRS